MKDISAAPPADEERDSDIKTMGVGSMVTTSAEKNFRARAHTTPPTATQRDSSEGTMGCPGTLSGMVLKQMRST